MCMVSVYSCTGYTGSCSRIHKKGGDFFARSMHVCKTMSAPAKVYLQQRSVQQSSVKEETPKLYNWDILSHWSRGVVCHTCQQSAFLLMSPLGVRPDTSVGGSVYRTRPACQLGTYTEALGITKQAQSLRKPAITSAPECRSVGQS